MASIPSVDRNKMPINSIKSESEPLLRAIRIARHSQLGTLYPVCHMGEISDIVGAIYLESVGFVTGEILHVDGGQSAGH